LKSSAVGSAGRSGFTGDDAGSVGESGGDELDRVSIPLTSSLTQVYWQLKPFLEKRAQGCCSLDVMHWNIGNNNA
jgi:hypothetical protein